MVDQTQNLALLRESLNRKLHDGRFVENNAVYNQSEFLLGQCRILAGLVG